MKELDFITYIKDRFNTKRPVVEGVGDDCAVLEYTRDKYMLLTTDMIAAGTHFTKKATPFQIGWKAMAVNISDIAAMGGVPKYALVSAGIPPEKNMRFLKGITKGIDALARKFNISIIGGDTNRAPNTVLSITLIGEVEKRCLAKRSGAKLHDLVFVTGALGEGRSKHLRFLPRLKEARILLRHFKISSMIDLSDGLSMDLNRLARASSVGVHIYKSLIPLSKKSAQLEEAIFLGEDFELLFTASRNESKRIIRRMGTKGDLPISLIGEVVSKRPGAWLIEEEGKRKKLKPKGYAHF